MKKILPVILILTLLTSFKSYSLPKLSSFPSAKATIFFDFDGQTVSGTSWNGGSTFYCEPAVLTDDQITEIFNRVSEDYRPFNINITTDSTVFLAAPIAQRVRIIVTPSSDWYNGNVGGISFTGSFVWGDDTPGFVFTNKLGNAPKLIAECCTHESGHTVGLSHQAKYSGTCTLISTYNDGKGLGETSWAPVMGNSYYRNLSGWNNGPTPYGCTNDQDNLSIITSRNGFTYRLDDHSNDPANNPTLLSIANTQFSSEGIITTNSDKDAFKINLPKNGLLHVDANPYSVGPNNEGADLDMEVTLLNSNMNVVKVYSPEEKLNVTIDTTLMAGDYFLVVKGSGNVNTSSYGSLGSYRIAGTYSPLTVTPISQVLLSGAVEKDKHDLRWSIISDEPIKSLSIESSFDGSIFNTLTNLSITDKNFSYEPLLSENIFYRLKVTSVTGQEIYSNVVPLKKTEERSKSFTISSVVTSEITVNASQNFQYQLADISGRIFKTGKADAGVSNINIKNSPNGIYILQIICNSQKTTQRILKL
ncbi:MAG: T9SS type A sorting domain-containing protein [Ginsengibacter sp.]